ncbi:aminopeptidase [Luteolibacter sp. SL250]|uniref:aminopeptidase n=1 Tax=Luteolibacter sp. SL250 TaxID=2995170 RepID=UPI00226EE98F|nr:aminopeptidase [Luteolibacter sp. SL250]WAC18542.1 aminopeptidase [Luteolibacter sp. SL250]
MLKWPCFLALLGLSSCSTVTFYRQAMGGQIEVMRKSRPNGVVLQDQTSPESLKKKLREVEEIRAFAESHLSLPGRESYGRYADLGREHVTWVLYAAPEFSLKPKTWWYPTLGRLDYRGYFRESDTDELAAELRGQGYDVYTGGVDAYSTLGWLHDPVLNTFVDSADVDLAELIFHELTHRKYFRNGATAFNESLANMVAEEGVQRWLAHHRRHADLRKFRERLVRRAQFYDRIDSTRSSLERLYASDLPDPEKRARKKALFRRLQDDFRDLRRRWGGRGLEGWLTADITNAHLVSVATYHQHLPTFRKLLKDCDGDLDLFFQRAEDFKLED